MIKEAPTSKQGYHARCACCVNLLWVDTTHGVYPGPDLCSQECYDTWCDEQRPDCTPPV